MVAHGQEVSRDKYITMIGLSDEEMDGQIRFQKSSESLPGQLKWAARMLELNWEHRSY